jgi:hypothetical protein
MEQLRETAQTLQTIVNRVREAVGTSEPAPIRESYRVRVLETRVSDAEYERGLARQRAERAEADVQRVIAVTEAGPPSGAAIEGDWERGWDAAMDAVRAALTPTTQTGCPCHNGDELCSGCRRCPDSCHGCDGPEYQPADQIKEK